MSIRLKSGMHISLKPASELLKTMSPEKLEQMKKNYLEDMDCPQASQEAKENILHMELYKDLPGPKNKLRDFIDNLLSKKDKPRIPR